MQLLHQWGATRFGWGSSDPFDAAAAERDSEREDSALFALRSELLRHCSALHQQQFVGSELGRMVTEAFNAAAAPEGGGDERALDKHMPRLSALLQAAALPARVSKHHRIDTVDAEGVEPAALRHALVFKSKSVLFPVDSEDAYGAEPRIVGALSWGGGQGGDSAPPPPPQIERFFVPHGCAPDPEARKYFPDPLVLSFVMGRELYCCSLVCRRLATEHDTGLAGVCLVSERPLVAPLRRALEALFAEHGEELRRDPESPALLLKLKAFLDASELVRQPSPHKLEPVPDLSLRLLLEALPAGALIKLFECALLERKVLVVSRRYSALTLCCEALRALLWPLRWQHVYAPVLPRVMLAHLECPTPFLIGINAFFAFKRDFPFVLDAVIVDLDEGAIEEPSLANSVAAPSRSAAAGPDHLAGDLALPAAARARLLRRVRLATQPALQACDSLAPPPDDTEAAATSEVRLAFHDVLSELLRAVGPCSLALRYDTEHLVFLDEEAFLASSHRAGAPSSERRFLETLMRSQAFSAFVARGPVPA